MRSILVAFLLALSALFSDGAAAAEPDMDTVRCTAIRDSAQCVSRSDCWYDAVNNKGCLKGPRPDEDACQVHGSQSICNVSTLGCAWNEAESKCVSTAN
jgi:hypothetical protein